MLDYHSARGTDGAGPINTYLAGSIVACLVFWPLGVPALVRSIQAKQALRRGSLDLARRYAGSAGVWSAAAMIIWLILVLLIVSLVVLLR